MFTILGLGSSTQSLPSAHTRRLAAVMVMVLASVVLVATALAVFHGTGAAAPLPTYSLHSLLADGGPYAVCGGGVGTHC